jgi:hypothetical protein
MNVYVVTRPDLGWDCVVGVFTVESNQDYEVLERQFPREFSNGSLGYHIHE